MRTFIPHRIAFLATIGVVALWGAPLTSWGAWCQTPSATGDWSVSSSCSYPCGYRVDGNIAVTNNANVSLGTNCNLCIDLSSKHINFVANGKIDLNGGTITNCSGPYYPACGGSNGGTFMSAPATSLCNAGTSSPVSTNATNFTWNCVSSGISPTPTISVACSALRRISGVCGGAAGSYVWNASGYAGAYCNAGTASSTPGFPTQGSSASWTCLGQNGGTNASCTATRAANPIPGVCGGAERVYGQYQYSWIGTLCSAGSASPASPSFPTPGGTTTWTCLGQNGGANATCSAPRSANAVCGAAQGGYAATDLAYRPSFIPEYCSVGFPYSTPGFPAAGSSAIWTCLGVNGGTNATCTATRATAYTYYWTVPGAWGSCSASCGPGTQYRSNTCMRSDGTNMGYSPGWCGPNPYTTSQACNNGPCCTPAWTTPTIKPLGGTVGSSFYYAKPTSYWMPYYVYGQSAFNLNNASTCSSAGPFNSCNDLLGKSDFFHLPDVGGYGVQPRIDQSGGGCVQLSVPSGTFRYCTTNTQIVNTSSFPGWTRTTLEKNHNENFWPYIGAPTTDPLTTTKATFIFDLNKNDYNRCGKDQGTFGASQGTCITEQAKLFLITESKYSCN